MMALVKSSLLLNSPIVDMPLKRAWTHDGLSEEADANAIRAIASRDLTTDLAHKDGSHPLLKVVWLTLSPGHIV